MLLLILWLEEGFPQSRLAASMGVEPPTATKLLQCMGHVGLTERGRALEQTVLEVGSTDCGRPVSHGAGSVRAPAHAGVRGSFLSRRCAGSPLSWERAAFF